MNRASLILVALVATTLAVSWGCLGGLPGTPTPTIPTATIPAPAEGAVAKARQALAERLGVSTNDVKVGEVRPTLGPVAETTKEASFDITLEAKGETYRYRGTAQEVAPIAEEIVGPGVPVIPPEATKLVQMAVVDLATKLGVPQSAIIPSRTEPVTWPDESLGVPEPGKTYPPKPTPGFVIVLAADTPYLYHSDLERVVFAGKQLRPDFPLPPLRGGTAAILVEAARKDLARRLNLDPTQVQLAKVESMEWPDSSLGLGQGEAFLPVITPGYRITLSAKGQQYYYHTDLARVVYAGTTPAKP